MDYFEGQTLEEYVRNQGTLPVDDLLAVARETAEALQVAHAKGILHRDLKPANLLVRKDRKGWQVRLIDFGLALKQSVIKDAASTGKVDQTGTGSSIAGTLDYAAPEQLGKLRGVPVRPYSDVYGFARTCCFALFQTPQPRKQHWESLPGPLSDLLDKCLADQPDERPANFIQVVKHLERVSNFIAADRRSHRSASSPDRAKVVQPDEANRPPLQSQKMPTPSPAIKQVPVPISDRRPALPDRSVDQGYQEYVARTGVVAFFSDQYRLQGPIPRHPEALIAECQRMVGLPLFSRTWFNPIGESARGRFRACLSGLERWAFFYSEYRGDYVNLWNQTASLFKVGMISPDHFQLVEVRRKYEGSA